MQRQSRNLKVFGHKIKGFLLKAPIFKHLRWGFKKVALDEGSKEDRSFSSATNYMHTMSELVEHSFNVVVTQERWNFWHRPGKVANQGKN